MRLWFRYAKWLIFFNKKTKVFVDGRCVTQLRVVA